MNGMVFRNLSEVVSSFNCSNHMIHLNYAILLINNDENEAAKRQFNKFEEKWSALSTEEREEEAEAEEKRQLLGKQLGIELVTNE